MASVKPFILIAEDDRFYAHIYELKLTKEGFDVQIAENGEKAMEYALKKTPHILLLDLVMPVKDGFETLLEFKKNPVLSAVPVIVLSNLGQDEDVHRAMDLGASDYIVKTDVSIQDVVAKIHSHIQ